jgi:hypothetical protein
LRPLFSRLRYCSPTWVFVGFFGISVRGMTRRMNRAEPNLRDLLQTLDPKARDDLRRVLIHDQPDRDAIASELMRYRDANGQGWADVIDFLTMYPDARRRVARVPTEIDA